MKKSCECNLIPFMHLLGAIFLFIPSLIALTSKKQEVKKNAKIILNWQLSLLIYLFISILILIIPLLSKIPEGETIISLTYVSFALVLYFLGLNIAFSIVASIYSFRNKKVRYPVTIPFFRE